MSTTVDSRVVEMKFDNRHFESNVSTTMSTLDKLKQRLNLTGASKGLENIGAAARGVDMSPLSSSINTVKDKFSALEIIGVTALVNITNSAVNAGKQLLKSLSVDQLSAGWQKFSDKTTSVATLVAQGNALEDVNDQLDRLNWFTDETSYNFTDMVSNIAKFTATGQGLEESVTAMEGIATWAALSGQNASTASRAMYQLSQAMGAGVMRLEDYKSIQNASMDTDEFRQKCLDAAIEVGTLGQVAEDTYLSLVGGGSTFSKSQFTTNLTEGAWLTSEVMMKVLNDYSAAVEGIYSAAEEKGMLASEVIDEIYTLAEKKSISTDEAISELGYDFDSFALKAFEAAQKARTFTDAIDSVKDAVSTGWMNTFELVFGDAEKATELWTDLANTLWDVFAATGEIRNYILEIALNFAEPWKGITDKLDGAGLGKITTIIESVTEVTETVANAAEVLEYFQDVVNRVWRGDFNNRGDNPDRRDLLTAAGYDPRVVQTLVNKGYQYKLTIEDVQKAHEKFGLTLETTTEETEKTIEVTNEATAAYEDLSDEQLKQAGLTEEEIALYRALEKEAKRLGISVSELAEEMSTNDGRTLLIDSFKNFGDLILGSAQAIKEAWVEIFNPPGAEEIAVRLYGIIKSLNEFSEKLRLTDKETGELNETGQKLQRTFKGIFAIVDILTTILGGGLKLAFKILTAVLDAFGLDILDVTAKIGDAAVRFRDWLESIINFNGVFNGAFKKAVPYITKAVSSFSKFIQEAVKGVISWISSLKGAENLPKAIAEGIVSGFSWLIGIIKNFGKSLKEGISDAPTEAIGSFASKVWDVVKIVGQVFVELGKILLHKFCSVIGVSDEQLDSFLSKVRRVISSIKEWLVKNVSLTNGLKTLGTGIRNAVSGIVEWVKSLKDAENVPKAIGEGIVSGLVYAITALVNLFKGGSSKLSESFGDVPSNIFAGLKQGLLKGIPTILSVLKDLASGMIEKVREVLGIHSPSTVFMAIGGFIISGLLMGILSGEGDLATAVKGLGSSLGNWLKESFADVNIGDILAVAFGAGLMGLSNKLLDTVASLSSPLEGVGEMIAGLGDMFRGIGKNFKASALEKQSKALLNVVIAIGILALVIYAITKIDATPGELWNAVGIVTVLAGVMLGLMVAINKLTNSSVSIDKSGVSFINNQGKTILYIAAGLLIMAFAIKKIAELDIEDPDTTLKILLGAVAGMAAIALLLSVMTNGDNGANMDKAGKMFIKMSLALLIIIYVIKLAGGLSATEVENGAIVVGCLGMLIAAFVLIAKNSGESVSKVGGMMLKISVALLILIGVIKLCGMLSEDEIKRGLTVIGIFGVFCAALIAVSYLAGENASKAGSMILKVSLALLVLAGVFILFRHIDDSDVERGLSIIKRFGWICVALVAVSKLAGENSTKAGTMILAISVALLIITGVIFLLSQMDPSGVDKGIEVISTLMVLIGVLIAVTALVPDDATGSLIALVAAVGVLAVALIALSFVDPAGLNSATMALSVVIAMFSLLVLASSKAEGSIGVLVTMVAALGVMAIALLLLAKCDGNSVLKSAIGLSILMVVMTGVLWALGELEPTIGSALKGAASLAIVSASLLVLVVALKMLSGVQNVLKNALGLAALVGAMLIVLIALSIIEPQVKKALVGLACLVILSGMLFVLVAALSLMNNVQNAMQNAIALSAMMIVMAGVLFILSAIGSSATQALIGVVAMIGLAGAMVVLSQALTVMGGMSWAEIGKSLVVLAGAFLILGVAAFALSGVTPVILALGAAFLMIGLGIDLAGTGMILLAVGVNTLAAALSAGAPMIAAGITTIMLSIFALIPALVQQIGLGIQTFCTVIIQSAPLIALAATVLILAFIQAIKAIVPAIIDLGVTILVSFLEGVQAAVPTLIETAVTIIMAFLDAIETVIPRIIEVGVTIVKSFLNAIKELVPEIVDTGISIIMSFITGIRNNIKEVVVTAVEIITEFIDGIAESLPRVIDSAFNLIVSFIEGLASAIDNNSGNLIAAVDHLITAILTAIKKWFSTIKERGGQIVKKIASGITAKVKDAKNAIGDVISKIVDKIGKKYSELKSAGKNIIDGFIEGIKDKIKAVGDAASEIGEKALNSIKDFLGIKSPSREFAKIGRWSDEGLAKGLGTYVGTVESAAEDVGSSALNSMKNAIAKVRDVINSDMDTQPTIRPVLDLSEVEAGAGTIGSLLGSDRYVGVLRNVGVINSMMSQRGQNGSNSDVVSAINKLSNKLDNIGNTTNNINGLTYDDDSNVSNAIKSLVRHMRIEGRV